MSAKPSMRILGGRSWKPLCLALVVLGSLCGCVYPDGGYDGAVVVGTDGGYGGAYYGPGVYGYGGWGGGYRVGPSRDGWRGQDHGGHGYRSAAPSRGTPSLPSRSRGHR